MSVIKEIKRSFGYNILEDVGVLEVVSQVLNEVLVFVDLGHFNGSLALLVHALDADLLGQEEQEYGHVPTHGSQVQVGVTFVVFHIQLLSPVSQLLNSLVASIENGNAHQRLLVLVEVLLLCHHYLSFCL